MSETHNKRVALCNRTTDRVRLWRATLEHSRRDGKRWHEYASWINMAGHAFRNEMGLRDGTPIGRLPEFDAFLQTFGANGLPF